MIKKLLYCLFGFCLFTTVVLSVVVSVQASQLVGIERKVSQVEDENKTLTEQIITKSSLTTAESEAQNLGLTSTRTVVYLNSDISVAQLR